MIGIGRDHEGPRLNGEQVVCAHEPHHPFVVDQHPAPTQFRRDAPVAIPTPVCDGDSLNGRPHRHLFFSGLVRLQRPIESRSAHLGQLTHPLDPQSALPRHHVPDLGVDARAPDLPLGWRRASTCCKAPLKKSTSKTFSANTRLSWLTSFRSVASRAFAGGPAPLAGGSSFSRQVYNRRRLTPSSFASVTMFSH